MDTTQRTALAKIGAWSLCFTVTLAAHAATPPIRETVPSRPVHLDLRPPGTFAIDASTVHGFSEFPMGHNRDLAGNRTPLVGDFVDSKIKPTSGVQALANRFHREGIPVARLWENHAALLSLGLNQRGKPGLWLIQKTH